MKIVKDGAKVQGIASIRKPASGSRAENRNRPAGSFAVKDRVTLSTKAKKMSRASVPPVIDRLADSIFSYEIRPPFAIPAVKKD